MYSSFVQLLLTNRKQRENKMMRVSIFSFFFILFPPVCSVCSSSPLHIFPFHEFTSAIVCHYFAPGMYLRPLTNPGVVLDQLMDDNPSNQIKTLDTINQSSTFFFVLPSFFSWTLSHPYCPCLCSSPAPFTKRFHLFISGTSIS